MEAMNFFKAGAFAFAVLCVGNVNAQNESINVADTAKVAEQQVSNQKGQTHYEFVGTVREAFDFLKDNREDTLVTTPVEVLTDTTTYIQGDSVFIPAGDTLYVHWKYFMNGPKEIRKDPLFILNEHVTEEIPVMSPLERKVARLAKEAAVVDKVNSGRERDRYGYRVTFDNGNQYELTKRAADKHGWQIGAYAGLQTGNHSAGFVGGGQLAYTGWWGEGTLTIGAAHNRYEDNAQAQYKGKTMWSLDSRAMGWFNLSSLWGDKYGVNRVLIGGGAGEMFYETKSREVQNPDGSIDLVQSRGNAFYWAVGAKYTRRLFNKGQSISFEVDAVQIPNVWQNQGQKNHWGMNFRVIYAFDCWRNRVRNK